MTAVVVAMLVIVTVATTVLAVVGGYYHLAGSPRIQRKVRRWRYMTSSRVNQWRGTGFYAMRVTRRLLARRLSRPPAIARVIRHPATR